MAIIIETTDKSGHVLQVHTFSGNSVRLGRAYDNDLILQDPSINPHHGLITWDPHLQQLRLQDLGALNGLWLHPAKGKKQALLGTAVIPSGQSLQLGKTFIKVYLPHHPIAPTQAIQLDQAITGALEHPLSLSLLTTLAVALAIGKAYLEKPFGPSTHLFSEGLIVLVAAAVFGGFWALIGKIVKQDSRFWLHTSFGLIALNLTQIAEAFAPILGFNLQTPPLFNAWAEVCFISGVSAVSLYFGLQYATRFKFGLRLALSLLSALFILGKPLTNLLEKPRFTNRPNYATPLVPPALQWRTPAASENPPLETETLYAPPTPNPDDEGAEDEDTGLDDADDV